MSARNRHCNDSLYNNKQKAPLKVRSSSESRPESRGQSIHASKDEVLGMFSADKDFGYQLGFVARVNLPMFYIQPELVYASHRFTMDMEDNASTKVKIKNMEVPRTVRLEKLPLSDSLPDPYSPS